MRKLTAEERRVILHKGTEAPFSGEYNQHKAEGIYCCKQCDAPLYRSEHKFDSHCGWPAFDDEIEGAVRRLLDADGHRTEIVCQQCGGHLGHVFIGEQLTLTNVRHCVNSISLVFKTMTEVENSNMQVKNEHKLSTATLGAGCFWCVEAIYSSLKGVIAVQSGYMGGEAQDASYKRVYTGETGHAEVVQISFDEQVISFEGLLAVFFQSHDPTSLNRQGEDIGSQYRSVVFAHDEQQKAAALAAIEKLTAEQIWPDPIVTQVEAAVDFYPAEDYHKDYFALHGEEPYCRLVIKPKVDKIKKHFSDQLK